MNEQIKLSPDADIPKGGQAPTPEQAPKGGDALRKELEQFPFIKKPVEQWSDEEKKSFSGWCSREFNNFYSTVSGVLDENSILFEDDEIPERISIQMSITRFHRGNFTRIYV